MTTTELKRLRERLWEHEDERLVVYDDATGKPLRPGMTLIGYPTIGVGRNLVTRGITKVESRMLLENDLMSVTRDVQHALPWMATLAPARQSVLVEMAFQMGLQGLLGFKKALTAVREGRYEDAAREMLDSKWARQTPARAKRLAQIMETGEWL